MDSKMSQLCQSGYVLTQEEPRQYLLRMHSKYTASYSRRSIGTRWHGPPHGCSMGQRTNLVDISREEHAHESAAAKGCQATRTACCA